jgi:uncharacterized protein YegJ (DUF2314 family)
MDLKKISWLAVFLVFLAVVSSANASIILAKHDITVDIDDEGYGQFTEKYDLVINRFEIAAFLQAVEENGKNIMKWRNDYDFIYPRIGSSNDLKTIDFFFDEENSVLEINYTWKYPLAVKEREEARTIKWYIPDSAFSNFIQGTTIKVEPNQLIKLVLPEKVRVDREEISSEISVQGNIMYIQDFTGSRLSIYYSTDKPIAPAFDTELILRNLLQNPLVQLSFIILAVLLVVLYINRKPFITRIENYILENSQLAPPEEEEVELE